jgi:hypothetical protein
MDEFIMMFVIRSQVFFIVYSLMRNYIQLYDIRRDYVAIDGNMRFGRLFISLI